MPDTSSISMRGLSPFKNTVVMLVVLGAVTAVIVVAALLVGGSTQPDFNGYWQSAPDQGVVIRLEGGNGTYTMSGMQADETTLTSSADSASTLAGDLRFQGGTVSADLTLDPKKDLLTMTLSTGEGIQAGPTVTFTRVPGSIEELDARLADQVETAKQSAIKEGIHSLQVGVQSWAVDHVDRFPDPSIVAKDKALSTYIDAWPKNPYTGEAMKQSGAPGDYTYEQLEGGAGFKLTGHFEGGGSFSVP